MTMFLWYRWVRLLSSNIFPEYSDFYPLFKPEFIIRSYTLLMLIGNFINGKAIEGERA